MRVFAAKLNSIRDKLEIDRAVFFGLLSRVWGLITGPVTALLIATKFTPEVQGYFYTFGTILALQVFVELGLGAVVQQFASHEWAKLDLDKSGNIVGDSDSLSRLISIARVASRWYLYGSIVVSIGLSIGGYVFFYSPHMPEVNWFAPWLLACRCRLGLPSESLGQRGTCTEADCQLHP